LEVESGTSYVHLNGRLAPAAEARIGVCDHGLLYGDGLFETVRVSHGRCFRPAAHLARLAESARRLQLALPWPEADLTAALQETAAANRLREGALRLTVTRGEGKPVPDPDVCARPTYFITARTVEPVSEAVFERGTRLCPGPQHPRSFVPGIKSLCFLPYQLARTAAKAGGFDDAVLLWDDRVVETGISNVFAVFDGVLTTPDLSSGCLPGVTRALLLDLAPALGHPARERPVTLSELSAADEVLVSNSVVGVLPVRAAGAVTWEAAPGPITRSLRTAYLELVRRETC
jgi:branched-chain amino acid aminotransferase